MPIVLPAYSPRLVTILQCGFQTQSKIQERPRANLFENNESEQVPVIRDWEICFVPGRAEVGEFEKQTVENVLQWSV